MPTQDGLPPTIALKYLNRCLKAEAQNSIFRRALRRYAVSQEHGALASQALRDAEEFIPCDLQYFRSYEAEPAMSHALREAIARVLAEHDRMRDICIRLSNLLSTPDSFGGNLAAIITDCKDLLRSEKHDR